MPVVPDRTMILAGRYTEWNQDDGPVIYIYDPSVQQFYLQHQYAKDIDFQGSKFVSLHIQDKNNILAVTDSSLHLQLTYKLEGHHGGAWTDWSSESVYGSSIFGIPWGGYCGVIRPSPPGAKKLWVSTAHAGAANYAGGVYEFFVADEETNPIPAPAFNGLYNLWRNSFHNMEHRSLDGLSDDNPDDVWFCHNVIGSEGSTHQFENLRRAVNGVMPPPTVNSQAGSETAMSHRYAFSARNENGGVYFGTNTPWLGDHYETQIYKWAGEGNTYFNQFGPNMPYPDTGSNLYVGDIFEIGGTKRVLVVLNGYWLRQIWEGNGTTWVKRLEYIGDPLPQPSLLCKFERDPVTGRIYLWMGISSGWTSYQPQSYGKDRLFWSDDEGYTWESIAMPTRGGGRIKVYDQVAPFDPAAEDGGYTRLGQFVPNTLPADTPLTIRLYSADQQIVEPCYSGVVGQGYSVVSPDSASISIVTPQVPPGRYAVAYDDGGTEEVFAYIHILDRNWRQKDYSTRACFPRWFDLGRRRLDVED